MLVSRHRREGHSFAAEVCRAVVGIACIMTCVWSLSSPIIAAELPSVVLIGDSIRMGYEGGVKSRLADKAVVTTPQENCRHTGVILENLQTWVLDQRPQLVHMNAGLHEIYRNTAGVRQVSQEQYVENLESILTRLEQANIPVIWSTMTPVMDERYLQEKGYVCRTDEDAVRYNQAALAVLQKHHVPVLDLHAAVMTQNLEDLYSRDGVHFNEAGSAFLAEQVANFILSHLAITAPAGTSPTAAAASPVAASPSIDCGGCQTVPARRIFRRGIASRVLINPQYGSFSANCRPRIWRRHR